MNVHEYQILLIDDDEDDFVHIRSLFADVQGGHYKLIWKSSYREGLEALKTNQFDACLLDYRLGSETGLELLREAHGLNISCPMILLTGYGDIDLDLQAMQIGASDYLVKNQLSPTLLERTVRYAIKHLMDMEELKESKAKILQQDRLASLGLLASSLAHEIGTPLGIIRSRSELAKKKIKENSGLTNDMDVVITQIDRIAKLVNSLLHLARGKPSDHSTAVNVRQVVQDVLNLLEHELVRKSVLLIKDIEGEPIVKAEPGPLGQVILNLLVNSLHAIEEAKTHGKPRDHQISLSAKSLGDSVEIRVGDTGYGISAENLPQLFKPFFTTKDIGAGTGLGLATSYKLVQSWGGTISVKSQHTQGTEFIITLPKGD